MAETKEMRKIIRDNWDEFLSIYYCMPCPGCLDGHNSHWKTVIESPQWKAWKATNPMYDFAENEELGCMSVGHFQDFLKFVITSNLELSITWVDGKAEWGIFRLATLEFINPTEWHWFLYIDKDRKRSGKVSTQELAQAACVDALKLIVTGGK